MLALNNIGPEYGAKKPRKRVGRGIGSGSGKTCGRGHKGQKARSGGFHHNKGFEGGQMPLYRRLPKVGFTSYLASITQEIRLSELRKVAGDVISLETVHAAGLINSKIERIKLILKGSVDKAYTVKGCKVTAGAKKAIEAAGGKVEE